MPKSVLNDVKLPEEGKTENKINEVRLYVLRDNKNIIQYSESETELMRIRDLLNILDPNSYHVDSVSFEEFQLPEYMQKKHAVGSDPDSELNSKMKLDKMNLLIDEAMLKIMCDLGIPELDNHPIKQLTISGGVRCYVYFCPKCGYHLKPINTLVSYCPKCGSKQNWRGVL